MSNKRSVNLNNNSKEYSAYYSDFRGVDFSSDHTQVHNLRFAYLCNMWRDYRSGQGKCAETIPGFRERIRIPNGETIYGIHECDFKDEEGNIYKKTIVHAGGKLYDWDIQNNTIVEITKKLIRTTNVVRHYTEFINEEGGYVTELVNDIVKADDILDNKGNSLEFNIVSDDVNLETVCRIYSAESIAGTMLSVINYKSLDFEMQRRASSSVVFNNTLYIIDGEHFLFYEGKDYVKIAWEWAYIPTTQVHLNPSLGYNENDNNNDYEQLNLISEYFYTTIEVDNSTRDTYYFVVPARKVEAVWINDKVLEDYAWNAAYDNAGYYNGIYFTDESYYNEGVIIKILARRWYPINSSYEQTKALIEKCTILSVYDNRVFITGNPDYPNTVFFAENNSITGVIDVTYFGEKNYFDCGIGVAPIKGMMPVSDVLMVLKADSQQDGTTFFMIPFDTDNDLQPRFYRITQSLSGLGCIGGCVNFLDDPVFISRFGLEGTSNISKLTNRLERALEHRSSNIDSDLYKHDLTKIKLYEFEGYLWCLCSDGTTYLADGRQRYTHETGVMQYEWYKIEDIGVYEGQETEYTYSKQLPSSNEFFIDNGENDIPIVINTNPEEYGMVIENNDTVTTLNDIIEVDKKTGERFTVTPGVPWSVVIKDENVAYLCDTEGKQIRGVFKPAVLLKEINNNLYFGTSNGVICSFNFDKRGVDGDISSEWYTFNGRAYVSGCATKMDNCGIPHLNKNTVKKSTVIKLKTGDETSAKIKIRSNVSAYKQVQRLYSTTFDFNKFGFIDLNFGQNLFAVNDKEKHWIEKQYYIYSDEFKKPFGLYYISFRYVVSGRYKNQN